MKIGRFSIRKNAPLDTWHHGDKRDPARWPAWKRFHLAYNGLPGVHSPSEGHRFWIYTRKLARDFDLYIDRRTQLK